MRPPRHSRSLLVPFSLLLGVGACREAATEPSAQGAVNFATAQTTQYTLVGLGGRLSEATAINPSGQIVGDFLPAGQRFSRGALWDHGVLTDLGDLGPRFGFPFPPSPARGVGATGINAEGDIVGDIHYPGTDRAFLWQNGVMTELAGLSPHAFRIFNYVNGINSAGQVVGQSWTDNRSGQATLWNHGVATALEDLPEMPPGQESIALAISPSGKVVGSAGGRAVLWWHGGVTDLGNLFGSGFALAAATAINGKGEIVGFCILNEFSGSTTRAFIWRDGVLTDLGNLGGKDAMALGINERGQVVGWSVTADGERHAFVWERQRDDRASQDGVMADLGSAGQDSEAHGISPNGRIVGTEGSLGAALWLPR